MRRTRLGALAVGLLTAGGLGLGLACSASATPAHPAAQPAGRVSAAGGPAQMVVFDCPAQAPLVRPREYILTCADANSYLGSLSWTTWTPRLASAYGTLGINDCNPYCAVGHFHGYPALVILWGEAAVKGHPGEHRYTMMTQILTGPRPRYYDYLTRKWVTAPVTQTTALPSASR
jgi:hypothetical protein